MFCSWAQVVQSEELLQPLSAQGPLPAVVVHGTYLRFWPAIRTTGLSRMKRNHVHLGTGLPQDGGVISGLRTSCEVAIYLNLPLALADGLPFFISANGVVLSPGNAKGVVEPKYFERVVRLKDGHVLYPEHGGGSAGPA